MGLRSFGGGMSAETKSELGARKGRGDFFAFSAASAFHRFKFALTLRCATRSVTRENRFPSPQHRRHNDALMLKPLPCPWPKTDLDRAYHDAEWGVPLHDDRALFELLILEGAQAGLSWSTILKKRANYRRAFDGFDTEKIARYDTNKAAVLLADTGIVRNRLKIAATIRNAQSFLAVQKEFSTFDRYLWAFVGGKPIVNRRRATEDIPTRTQESDALSKDLLSRGFKFVGSTICHAFMQASGMVNDHLVTCPRHAVCSKLS